MAYEQDTGESVQCKVLYILVQEHQRANWLEIRIEDVLSRKWIHQINEPRLFAYRGNRLNLCWNVGRCHHNHKGTEFSISSI